MNDKFIIDTMSPHVDKALKDGTFYHNFLMTIVKDDNNEQHFKISGKGTDSTLQGDMFALTNIAHEVFKHFSEEYNMKYREVVEMFLGYVSDYYKMEVNNGKN